MPEKLLPLIPPGEILSEEFLKPMGITQQRLAKYIGMSASSISDIVKGNRSITAGTATLLAKTFGTSPMFWLNLQATHDLEVAQRDRALQRRIRKVKPASIAAQRDAA